MEKEEEEAQITGHSIVTAFNCNQVSTRISFNPASRAQPTCNTFVIIVVIFVICVAAAVLEQIQNQIQIYREHHVLTTKTTNEQCVCRAVSDNGGVWLFTRR